MGVIGENFPNLVYLTLSNVRLSSLPPSLSTRSPRWLGHGSGPVIPAYIESSERPSILQLQIASVRHLWLEVTTTIEKHIGKLLQYFPKIETLFLHGDPRTYHAV